MSKISLTATSSIYPATEPACCFHMSTLDANMSTGQYQVFQERDILHEQFAEIKDSLTLCYLSCCGTSISTATW
jgi:hypothetical protein